jgi:predicted RNA-binding Zn ribbon-like protein
VCLDFVNTLDDRFSDHPRELLASYPDLARFAEDAGLLSHQQADHLSARSQNALAQRALKSAIQMREAMSEVFYALANGRPVPKPALAILNRYVQEAAQHAQLAPANGHFAWQFDPAQDNLESPLWPIARSAAELLAADQLQYVRACASPTCEWLFLDESKNHRRRWCDMTKCGNRAKVQSFYNRKRNS